ncbi:MAG: hypothetical protein ABI895_00490 [Deltaproteobacteria bacterium]
MTQLRIGIRFGTGQVEILPPGGEARVEFRDGGEGSYRVTQLQRGQDVLVGQCGYSGALPGRTEELTMVIEKTGVTCQRARDVH